MMLRAAFPSGRYSQVAENAWDGHLSVEKLNALFRALARAVPHAVVAEAPYPVDAAWSRLRDSRTREVRIALRAGPSWGDVMRMTRQQSRDWLKENGPYKFLNLSISRLAPVWIPVVYETQGDSFEPVLQPSDDVSVSIIQRVRDVMISNGFVELSSREANETVPWIVREDTGGQQAVSVYDCLFFSDLD